MTGARLALYFDDPPVDPETDSRGLGPINARMMDLFGPRRTVINAMRLRKGQRLYRSDEANCHSILKGLDGAAIRATGRFSRRLTTFLEARRFRTLRWPTGNASHMFAPVGSDLGSVHRALLAARREGAKLLLYLVDDPLDLIRRVPGAERHWKWSWLTNLLQQCELVFGITGPLCEILTRHHGIEARTLPLPYTYDPGLLPRATKNQIIYVGSVNEIYGPELTYWIELLERIGFFRAGQLIVTGDVAPRHGVVCTSFPSRQDLEQEIADSRAALLPISSKLSELCYSSFPSKTLDYLAYSRLILASAPEGCVVADLFATQSLHYCFPESRVPGDVVSRLLASSEDHLARYREVIDQQFSPAAFAASVLAHVPGA